VRAMCVTEREKGRQRERGEEERKMGFRWGRGLHQFGNGE